MVSHKNKNKQAKNHEWENSTSILGLNVEGSCSESLRKERTILMSFESKDNTQFKHSIPIYQCNLFCSKYKKTMDIKELRTGKREEQEKQR